MTHREHSSLISLKRSSAVSCAAVCFNTGRGLETKYNRKISVTRAHHPLLGKIFELAQPLGNSITIILPNGCRMKIPRQWSDIDGAKPCLSLDSVFTGNSIKELLDLVDLLLNR